MLVQPPLVVAPPSAAQLDSVFDMVLAGGPVMIPLVLSSIIAATYAIERALRLRARALGTAGFDRELLAAVGSGGVERGLELCSQRRLPASRVMRAALSRWNEPRIEREQYVEEAGRREVRTLSGNLKPLVYVAMLSPLLGFLGTVYGMIVAFSTVALQDGLGKPEMLAAGISQALITTAAGLTIAIPTQVAYFWLRSRVERFARKTEELYERLAEALAAPRTPPVAPPPPSVEPDMAAVPAL